MRESDAVILSTRGTRLRYVRAADAARILELRREPSRSGVLSVTVDDVDAQRAWLARYAERHADRREHYFMVCGSDGAEFGTARIHDVEDGSCWWGSWVLARDTPVTALLESYVMVNFFIFEHLGLQRARFRVMPTNLPVIRFHDAMRSPRVAESDGAVEYLVDARWYGQLKERLTDHFSCLRVPGEQVSSAM